MTTAIPCCARRWRYAASCVLVVLLGLPWVASLDAPVLYGSIVGNVRDASGGVLPGATVAITHNETKAKRETVSDAAGAYRFPTLQPGTYTVVVTMTGFQTFTRNEVPVTPP